MSDPDLYDNPEELRKLNDEYAEIEKELAALYEKWEDLAEFVASQEG